MHRVSRFGGCAVAAVAAVMLAGCATLHVSSFVERGVDFNRYHTYAWAPENRLNTGDPRLDNNAFFLERLQQAVDTQLAVRGFQKITSGTPALVLHYHASVTQQLDMNGADQIDGHCDSCQPYVYDAGTLLLDFVDANTHALVWRGWAEGGLGNAIDSQTLMEQQVDESVARILQTLPRRL